MFIHNVKKLSIITSLILLACFANSEEYHVDPEYATGPEACGECHEKEKAVWSKTRHFKTFKEMASSDDGKEIAKKMGIKRIDSNSDCRGCHFTAVIDENEELDVVAGISCESCHGAAIDWMDIHADYGDDNTTAETETPEHREERYQYAEAAGMIRPENLYFLVANCFDCHTVPNEKLINVGGHTPGSKIELVRWLQGEVRHNVYYSEGNNEAPLERRRVLYVLGKMLDLEFSLRNFANAKEKDEYARAMLQRVKRAGAGLNRISKKSDIPEVNAILDDLKAVKIKLGNQDGLLQTVKLISTHAKKFARLNDGSEILGLDSLLPSDDKYKGDVYHPE